MPSQQQLRWSQLRVGVTVIVAVVILAILIFLMNSTGGIFTKKIQLRAYFDNASGLREEPVIRLQSIIHRDDPIVLGCVPGKPPNDNTFYFSSVRAALIWDELEKAGVPGIRDCMQ